MLTCTSGSLLVNADEDISNVEDAIAYIEQHNKHDEYSSRLFQLYGSEIPPYLVSTDNVVYSLRDYAKEDDDEPNPGVVYKTLSLEKTLEEYPDALFAVKIDSYSDAAIDFANEIYQKRIQFLTEKIIDGKPYREFMDEYEHPQEKNEEFYRERPAKTALVQQINQEADEYEKALILESENPEINWLEENGIQIVSRSTEMNRTFYAILTADQIKNFPVDENRGFGYKLFLSRLDDVNLTNTSEEPEITPGDVTGTGNVNVLDVVLTNKAVYGKAQLSESQLKAADVNKNQKADFGDSLTMMQYIVGITDTLE